MIVYADSSFLVALYVLDRHSPLVLSRMRSSPRILVTPFHEAELANALYQCVFRSTMTEFEAARAWKRFEGDLAGDVFQYSDLAGATWIATVRLAQRFCSSLGVRTLDTLHVASAMELNAERFWTFDQRQARLAEAAGLDIRG